MLHVLTKIGSTTVYGAFGTPHEASADTRSMLDALPRLKVTERRELNDLYRMARILPEAGITARPLRSVHHTISPAGMFGNNLSIGEVALCHLGAMLLFEPLSLRLNIREHLPKVLHEGHTRGIVARPAAVVLHVERH
jgi:predicted ATPase with chaperone activity